MGDRFTGTGMSDGTPRDALVLASSWNRDDIARVLRSRLQDNESSVTMGRTPVLSGRPEVLILDRVPFDDANAPALRVQRSRTPRWFLEHHLPRCLQRFRFLASQVAPDGGVVVLDGRMHARWARPLWESVPGTVLPDWDAYQVWAQGGAA